VIYLASLLTYTTFPVPVVIISGRSVNHHKIQKMPCTADFITQNIFMVKFFPGVYSIATSNNLFSPYGTIYIEIAVFALNHEGRHQPTTQNKPETSSYNENDNLVCS